MEWRGDAGRKPGFRLFSARREVMSPASPCVGLARLFPQCFHCLDREQSTPDADDTVDRIGRYCVQRWPERSTEVLVDHPGSGGGWRSPGRNSAGPAIGWQAGREIGIGRRCVVQYECLFLQRSQRSRWPVWRMRNHRRSVKDPAMSPSSSIRARSGSAMARPRSGRASKMVRS